MFQIFENRPRRDIPSKGSGENCGGQNLWDTVFRLVFETERSYKKTFCIVRREYYVTCRTEKDVEIIEPKLFILQCLILKTEAMKGQMIG